MKILQKFKPIEQKIIPWEDIEKYYQNLISHGWMLENMVSLIQFIRNNNYDKRLFGYIVSLEKLVITIYNPAELHRESLYIEFNRQNRRWHFEYFAKPYEREEAERYCDEEDGIKKFLQYIKWLNW